MDTDHPTKAQIDLKDDLRLACIVSKYEGIKFMSGKKILIFGILIAAVLVLISIAVLGFGGDNVTTEGGIYTYISFVELLALIGATLFSSVTLVSEFEERTSLMLFTKPIRKSSIFLGKFAAAFILNFVFILFYYVVAVIMIAIKTGGFTDNIIPSFGLCVAYIFSLTGIAIFFSAWMKKSSSASILTFIFILLVPGIVGLVIAAIASSSGASVDLWFILDSASLSVVNTITGEATNGLRDLAVMLIWGIIPTVAGYYLFKKREV